MRIRQLICIALVIALNGFSLQQARAQAADSTPAWAPLIKPEIFVEKADGAIRIDGRLDDEGWMNATRITQFSEFEPSEQGRPIVETEAWITYDSDHLYIAFKAYDDPRQIRASLRNRDEIFQDDWVGIILDPYGDATRAYEIFSNPLGVQGDLLMSRSGENVGFDMIYTTAGQITDFGYVVEMAIPFKSLRFPAGDVQDWNITFLRNYPRSSRHVFTWAAVSRDDSCLLCQLGVVRGITGVQGGGSLEILPAIVGSQASNSGSEPQTLEHGRVSFEPSLNLRYNVTSSLTAEATLNPDFSQVESDAAQIDVNTTFALFYPERRPFFQEGSEMFETMIDVVYTRSINSPVAAVKMTGQPGRTSVGFISAVDERTPILLPFRERSDLVEAGQSVSNILRGRHSFGSNSFVGGILSDRRYMIGGSGTEIGFDGQWQLTDQIRVLGQFVASHSIEPDASDRYSSSSTFADGRHTAALDGETFTGYGAFLRAGRYGRHWNLDATYQAYSPTFRAANGFVSRNDYRRLSTNPMLSFYPDAFVDLVRPSLLISRQWGFDGTLLQRDHQARLFMRMKGQTNLFAMARYGSENYRGHQFDNLWWVSADGGSQFSDPLSVGAYVGIGRSIARFTDVPEIGRAFEASLSSTIKPLQRLVFRPRLTYASLTDVESGAAYYSGYIARARMDLLFTRELSIRLVTQYNDFSSTWSLEPLVSYRLNAYSVMYVGSTQQLRDYGEPFGYSTSSRQFFFKLQYLFRT